MSYVPSKKLEDSQEADLKKNETDGALRPKRGLNEPSVCFHVDSKRTNHCIFVFAH